MPDNARTSKKIEAAVARQPEDSRVSVSMRRTEVPRTDDQALWVAIRNNARRLSFTKYREFMDTLMCDPSPFQEREVGGRVRALPFPNTDPYLLLKTGTETFMMMNCGVCLRHRPGAQVRGDGRRAAGGGAESDSINEDEEAERLGWTATTTMEEIELAWDRYLQSGPRLQSEVRDNKGKPPRYLPYLAVIRTKLGDIGLTDDDRQLGVECFKILRSKFTNPCLLELIWSYWHEEGMLCRTMGAISERFQNRRGANVPDPLVNMEIDPLRPLNNFLWGYVQDEQHRLTPYRRTYEYDHHYGVQLLPPTAPAVQGADSRSRFLEAFHNLLNLAAGFFKEDDDTTVIADGFPVLNGLKEVHVLLTEGQHNQYGDLPWTARQEMLMEQWLLARPEMRDFLPTRTMVAYPEPWMDMVDSMKRLQWWTDASIMHFHDLGHFGEQILLSIRYGNWNSVTNRDQAANWARYWRSEIQGYLHAYRVVTGVDLTADRVTATGIDATMPAIHLRRRLIEQVRARQAGVPQAGGRPQIQGRAAPGSPVRPGRRMAPAPLVPPVPGAAPGTVVPGTVVPGSVVPGSVVPGSVVPGSVVPGSVVPGRPAPLPPGTPGPPGGRGDRRA
jgi:hypothetical protein